MKSIKHFDTDLVVSPIFDEKNIKIEITRKFRTADFLETNGSPAKPQHKKINK